MTKMPPRTNVNGSRTAVSRGVAFSASPVLKVKLSSGRSRFVLIILFLAFVALGVRALWLQSVSDEFLQQQGASRYARTLEMPAIRGRILDRNGQVLASSLPVKAIWGIPDDMQQATPEQLQQMEQLLDIKDQDLRKKMESDRGFVYIKRQVDNDIADQVMALKIPGVSTKKEYKRFYPEGEVMAHVVGFTSIEDDGQEGMELGEQKTLAGVNGSRRVIKDRLGRIIEDIGSIKEPHDGKDLTLSLDSKIQYIAYTQIKAAVELHHAKAGGIVVLDAKTGEVLALASVPTYNPNDRRDLTGEQLRNRVLTDTFEPGSTLKPFTVSLALNDHLVTPDTIIDTGNGKFKIGTAIIGDTEDNGKISVAQVIQRSSNIGASKIAFMMQPKMMWDLFTELGFGQQPHVQFPGAAAGIVRPWNKWRPIEQATMSYGHGISLSLIQLARAYTIFADNGNLMPISFLKQTTKPVGTPVISSETAAEMRKMLESVVSPTGTAPFAQVPGYRVGGKTGTAYKIENGKYVHKYVADFVGIAPMSNPRIVVAVMLDEPTVGGHWGGRVAGPVFSAVTASTLRALNVPPDSNVTDVIIPKNVVEESF